MLDLNENKVSQRNDEDDLSSHASLVIIKELKTLRSKIKICVPTEANDFWLMLKRYAKLIVCNIFRYLPFIQVQQPTNPSTSRIFQGCNEENESRNAGFHFMDDTSTIQVILDGGSKNIVQVYDNSLRLESQESHYLS